MAIAQTTTLAFHPIANIFPLLEGESFARLVEDVRVHGLREAIWLHRDGSILDGRNRYRACLKANVVPQCRVWDGQDADLVSFLLSLNLHRRHLDESQRALVRARAAEFLPHGGDRKSEQFKSANAVLKAFDTQFAVSTDSVARARQVLDSGTAELIAAVEQGQVAVSLAARIAELGAETQRAILVRVEGGERPIEAMRQVKASQINARQIAEPTGKYRVLYADPPWRYGNTMPPGSTQPDDYYPTMSLADICALPVRDLAEEDAVLFLWVTSPILREAFDVIAAWGFGYKSSFVWDKVLHNMGHYNSMRHEFLLLATRGSCQPDVRKLFDSVVTEERTAHSAKPETFRAIIDTIYPKGKRIELFRRGPAVKGWRAWGKEITT